MPRIAQTSCNITGRGRLLLRPERKHALSKSLLYLLAFLIPAYILLLVFARMGIYPFGEKTLLIVDMDSEYIDYFTHLNKLLWEQGSFLRSWDMGMGLNMLGLIAFYAASPLNLLAMLMPAEQITEAVLLVTLLKIGLCGVMFYHYAARVFGEGGPRALCFSTAYALMAYNIAYSSNIMWLDGAAFLPLVLLGAEKILRENRRLAFVLSLVYVFLTSYYIGYMIGVFSFLYFTAVFFGESTDWRLYLRKFRVFLTGAALAAGCCAFLLLPAFLNLKNGQSALWQVPVSFHLSLPLTELTAKLLPGVYDTLTDSGLPNIYCSVAGAFCAVLYFVNRAVPRQEKAVFGAFSALLLLSFSCDLLNLGWHAFEEPTWFPARYSFLFSFLILHLGLRCLCRPEGLTRNRVMAAAGILIALFAETGVQRHLFLQATSLWVGLALAVFYAVILLVKLCRKRTGTVALALCALALVCAETGWNAARMVAGMDGQFHYRERESYLSYRREYAPAVAAVEAMDKGVYRMEALGLRNANGGMALAYRGISHYSTTTDQALNAFLRALGYNRGTENELRFARGTPLTNGLLGIRYILSKEDMGGGYKPLCRVGDIGIYENEAAFPLAFWAPEEALAFSASGADPFALQNEWLHALEGERGLPDVFSPLQITQEKLLNTLRSEEEGHIQYLRRARLEEASVELTVKNPNEWEAYAFLPVYDRRFSRVNAYVDGRFVQRELAYRQNALIPLGAGETALLKLEIQSDKALMEAQYAYALDLEHAVTAAREAQANAVRFGVFADTQVTGILEAPNKGIIATTFPYDTGWRVWVDGKAVETRKLCGVFLAVPVVEGEHRIVMRYRPPGWNAGIAISALCVAGVVLWYARRRQS